MKTISYRDYEGTCEIDVEEGVCHGKLLFIDDLITYESETPKQLIKEFEAAVDDYIQTCNELGIEAKKPLKGQFNVRITPELHKALVLRSHDDNVSLNEVVKRSIESYLNSSQDITNHFNIIADKSVISTIVSADNQWFNMQSNTRNSSHSKYERH